MLQLIFPRCIKVTAFGFSTALLVFGQTAVNAQQDLPRLTPTQIQNISRDLVPYNSQEFFRQGQELMEREIQLLRQRQISPKEPVLKVNSIPPIKEDSPERNDSKVLPN